MSKKAWLEGHEFDLQDLAKLLPDGETRVIHEDDRYYLASSAIDNPSDGESFHEVARAVLAHVNGLGRTNEPSFRPVALSGLYDDGDGRIVAAATAKLELRARLTAEAEVAGAQEIIPSPTPQAGPGRVKLATSNTDVAEALTIMGQPDPLGWVAMNKVYEIIKHSLIKPDTIERLGWATKDQISAFGASANLPSVSGEKARHARPIGGTPQHSMSEAQGRQFVSRLVTSWLDALR